MDYVQIIFAAAKTAKISGPLLLAICTHESGLKNTVREKDGKSSTYGVCQIKLETAQMLGYKGSWYNLMIPEENIRWAARYVKYQESRYGNDWCKIVSAYNSGSFAESKRLPGKPRNLAYVQLVRGKLDRELQDKLSCEIDVNISKDDY
jgi:soluble lytic murein transglycosylase-like protein